MTVFLACRNDSFPCLPQGSRACRETRPLSSRAQPRDLSRTPCGLCAVSQQYGLHMTNTRTRSDPFEGARSFTLLARGKTSAPQSAAYGRMPMATCCRKRRLFRRRLLRGGYAAAPLRVTPRDFSFNNFLRVRKPRFFVVAVGCALALPQGAMLACALPVLLFPKISGLRPPIFGSPVVAYLRLSRKGVNARHQIIFCKSKNHTFCFCPLRFAESVTEEGEFAAFL